MTYPLDIPRFYAISTRHNHRQKMSISGALSSREERIDRVRAPSLKPSVEWRTRLELWHLKSSTRLHRFP